MKLISTTALAKDRKLEPKNLFDQLKSKGWIYKKDEQWNLTKEGKLAGGETQYNPKFGEYIVWPSNIDIEKKTSKIKTLKATEIGNHFTINNQKVNLYLSELGWIEKKQSGWIVTKEGKKHGGYQMELPSGIPFCVWDESIIDNKFLKRSINIGQGTFTEKEKKPEEMDSFRSTNKASIKTADGHMVRSRAELVIDNFLYHHGIVHAYERRVNIDEIMFCDFYLPKYKVFIEFWGLDDDPGYLARKKVKLDLYAKNGYKLVEIHNSDFDNLEEILTAKLRKYDVTID